MAPIYFLQRFGVRVVFETELDLYELTCLCPTVFQPVETAVVQGGFAKKVTKMFESG